MLFLYLRNIPAETEPAATGINSVTLVSAGLTTFQRTAHRLVLAAAS